MDRQLKRYRPKQDDPFYEDYYSESARVLVWFRDLNPKMERRARAVVEEPAQLAHVIRYYPLPRIAVKDHHPVWTRVKPNAGPWQLSWGWEDQLDRIRAYLRTSPCVLGPTQPHMWTDVTREAHLTNACTRGCPHPKCP
jgi:hypothetical protein